MLISIRFIYYFILLCILLPSGIFEKNEKSTCGRAKNCKDCMSIDPLCSWCYADNFDDSREGPGYRCAPISVLRSRGCLQDYLESVNSTLIDDGSSLLPQQSATEDIQFTPRLQTVKLRPNDGMSVDFKFQSISDYPVDLYFLTDLSYTMSDDLDTVSKMTYDIVSFMRTVTKKLHMGFGAFVDKPVFPFVVPTLEYLQNPCLNVGSKSLQCDPPFLYKHILSLTDDFKEFQEKTKVTRPSGNLDSPEGGLDALLQVARCNEIIKWRANARKIVLFASDGGFHLAGDGRIAGLIRPPPTTCQLTYQPDRFNSSLSYVGWHTADQTDYPSVGEIAQVLTDKDISVIFAVDSKLHALYSSLTTFLPSAAVGILSDSSTNIVELLRDNYNKIVNKAELMAIYDSDSLEVQVFTKCNDEDTFSRKAMCSQHPVGGRIEYRISVKAKHCFKEPKTVQLKMIALEDQAIIKVETACSCPTCDKKPQVSFAPSPRCQSRGYLHCGSCTCDQGYSGDFCECSAAASAEGDMAMLVQCTAPEAKEPCSGRGRCTCGKCKCNLARYEGDFCECDRHGCKRASDDNQVCGGPQRGTCQCNGTCVCKPGYAGDRCDCMAGNTYCKDPKNQSAPMCSGHGICDCGQCFCDSGYTGHLCNEIQGGESALCTDREVEKCVLCLRDALVKLTQQTKAKQAGVAGATGGDIQTVTTTTQQQIDDALNRGFSSPEYVAAVAQCDAVCNDTIIDTKRVQLVESSEQEDSNLCIIYADNDCRVFFTYRYSDAVYKSRKVELNIRSASECAPTVNILYIVLGVIAAIVLGGLILLLIYKLVITIDDRRELAKFEKQGKNVRWEMAENPIFESPTTKVTNPTFQENGF